MGSGKLLLGNAAYVASATSTATISCPIEVNAADNNPAFIYMTAHGREITIDGVLSGSGYLRSSKARANSGYTGNKILCSDTTKFTGTLECSQGDGRNYLTFAKTCDFSKAKVILSGTYNNNGAPHLFNDHSNSAVYKFGSLSGTVNSGASGLASEHPIVEVGSLNNADQLTGQWNWVGSGRGPIIRKVGTGVMTITELTGTYAYILNGGTLVVKSTDTTACTTECANAIVHTETDTEAGTTTYTLEAVASKEVTAASAEAAVAAATVNVTAAQAAAGVESSYYKVVATETSEGSGTYALTVEFADEVVPEVSEETVNDTTVTFTMTNFKKGLWYGVASGTTTEPGDPESMVQCTDASKGVTLSADIPGEGTSVMYYKVVVKDTNTNN